MLRCLLILLAAVSAHGATYYVRTDGNNSNSGTENTAGGAWLTVQKAASTMVAGDTAIVADGSYAEIVTSGAAGTLESPITFQGQSTNAVLRGFVANHAGQVLDSFTLTGESVDGFDAVVEIKTGAHNCVVNRCFFPGSPLHVFQIATVLSTSDLVTNLHVLNNRFVGGNHHSVMLRCGRWHLVESNYFTGKVGNDAMQVFADDVIVRGNLFTNWDNAGLREGEPLVVGVSYYFEDVGTGADFSNVGAGAGPYQTGEDYKWQATGTTPTSWGGAFLMTGNHPDIVQSHNQGYDNHSAHNLLFENNVVIDCEGEVQLSNISDDANLNNITGWTYRNNLFVRIDRTINLAAPGFKFFNNTFYQCAVNSGSVLTGGVYDSGTTSNLTFYNNLMVECGDPTYSNQGWYNVNPTTNQLMDYNLVVGTGAGTTKQAAMWTANGREAHGLNGVDPMFVNASANDFRLSTNSPAIGAGYALNELFSTDIRGLTRGAAWDIGAYEFAEGEEPGSATAVRVNVGRLIRR